MVVLGSYGSCDAWVGELRLDVLTVHLIAAYAKIVISATPADSEITDDPASADHHHRHLPQQVTPAWRPASGPP